MATEVVVGAVATEVVVGVVVAVAVVAGAVAVKLVAGDVTPAPEVSVADGAAVELVSAPPPPHAASPSEKANNPANRLSRVDSWTACMMSSLKALVQSSGDRTQIRMAD
ncbi:MAG: hypothetical protein ACHQAR_03295 [Steroidobacterales bacterium]